MRYRWLGRHHQYLRLLENTGGPEEHEGSLAFAHKGTSANVPAVCGVVGCEHRGSASMVGVSMVSWVRFVVQAEWRVYHLLA